MLGVDGHTLQLSLLVAFQDDFGEYHRFGTLGHLGNMCLWITSFGIWAFMEPANMNPPSTISTA